MVPVGRVMKKAVLIAFLFLVFCSVTLAQSDQNQPADNTPCGFESDGCSLFPDGNYCECCIEHDKQYFRGGSAKERRAADKKLYRCVKAKGGWKNKVLAPMMYLGVRVFGTSVLPTSFRWGFGKSEKWKKKCAEAQKAALELKEADSVKNQN
jgi:hypothetical protein